MPSQIARGASSVNGTDRRLSALGRALVTRTMTERLSGAQHTNSGALHSGHSSRRSWRSFPSGVNTNKHIHLVNSQPWGGGDWPVDLPRYAIAWLSGAHTTSPVPTLHRGDPTAIGSWWDDPSPVDQHVLLSRSHFPSGERNWFCIRSGRTVSSSSADSDGELASRAPTQNVTRKIAEGTTHREDFGPRNMPISPSTTVKSASRSRPDTRSTNTPQHFTFVD